MIFRRLFLVLAVAIAMLVISACTREPERDSNTAGSAPASGRGEALFRQFCANCHPDGGNVSDPTRNLHRSTLRANGINKPEDIIRIMRNPVSRMLRFDEKTLPDEDAKAIAGYVLETF